MPSTQEQERAFLALKEDVYSDELWHTFLKEWDGFISAIISRKLFFATSLWEDAKMVALAKIFRYIHRFDTQRPISPWMAKVVVSACEDVKPLHLGGAKPAVDAKAGAITTECSSEGTDDADEYSAFEVWAHNLIQQDNRDNEVYDDMWCCIYSALDALAIDEVKKNAFLLYYRFDWKLREIAAKLRLPQSTVNNWPGSVLQAIMPRVQADLRDLGYAPQSEPEKRRSRR